MKYFKNKKGEVFGYDETQGELIGKAIKEGLSDVTASWPPVAPKPTEEEAFLTEIIKLERTITQRRIRGAIGGNQEDIDYIKGVEAEIAVLRDELAAING